MSRCGYFPGVGQATGMGSQLVNDGAGSELVILHQQTPSCLKNGCVFTQPNSRNEDVCTDLKTGRGASKQSNFKSLKPLAHSLCQLKGELEWPCVVFSDEE